MKSVSRLNQFKEENLNDFVFFPVLLFLGTRLILILTLPLQGLVGYGDLPNYIQLAQLPGWPFINYWVEFPPIFPFLNTFIYHIVGGVEPNYDYLSIFLLSIIDAINLVLFIKIAAITQGIKSNQWRITAYLVILIAFSYAWWYFDSIAVLGMLLSLYLLFKERDILAGSAIAFGGLVKLFPLVLLVIPWCYYSRIRAIKVTITAIVIMIVVYGGFYLASPEFTQASIVSQFKKGSWETVWALVDGNYQTGSFGAYAERLVPEAANETNRNPAVINPLWTLLVFGAIGLWIFLRSKEKGKIQPVIFTGLTLCILFLWSPGWSPQWILFLLPLILLTLPRKEALLMTGTLILVNILEWPVLLSRGLFSDIWVTIVLRTLIFVLLAITWFSKLTPNPQPELTVNHG